MAPASISNFFSLCGDSVWDSSLSWDTDHPLLTECFQSTILTWIPTLFLLICAPLQFLSRKKKISPTPEASAEVDPGEAVAVKSWSPFWTPWVAWKSLAIAGLQAANIIKFLNDLINYRQYGVATGHIVGTVVEFIGLSLSLAYLLNERRRRRHTSGTQFFYWLLLLVAHGLRVYTTTRSNRGSRLDYYLEVIMFIAALLGFIAQLFADNYKRRSDHDDERECPVARASFLSNITFFWLSGIMLRGWRRPLLEKDLWTPLEENRTDYNVINFNRAWQREVDQSNQKAGNRLPSVFRAAYHIVAGTFWSGVVFMLLDVVFMFLSPQLLKLLIGFVADPAEYQWHGFVYAVALLLVSIGQSLCQNQYFNASYITGMNLRSAVMASVYRKALRVSNDARNQATVGEMVNLISIDAQRFLDFMGFVYMLLNAPIIVVVAIVFLWNELGLAVLGGLAVIVLLVPLNICAGGKQRTYLTAQMKEKDQRIRSMSEILGGMKVLKLYAWEMPFIERISKIRTTEIRLLLSANYVMALMNFFFQLTPFLIALGSFAMYVLLSPTNVLTAQKAFVSLALFNILRLPLGMLPFIITMMVQFRISLQRVNRFLSSDELDLNSVKRAPLSAADRDGMSVIIQDGTFSWTKKRDNQPALRDINLAIPRGKLVAVVGQVGCGKSSLCAAILGQMEKLKGSVEVRGSVAYVPQQAWIQNMTVRDNIMFSHPSGTSAAAGKVDDERAYRKVLSACALDQDLEMMPAGDETEIGEKGMNLSGGQKQRVSLARATFSNTDVIILDDPLSAVDSHVAKHIFENLLSNEQGLLQHKTRILVTHNISFLPKVDQIVVMNDGVITEVGTYHQLLDKGGAFADFLREYLIDNRAEDGQNGEGEQNDGADEGVTSDTDSETRRVKQEILNKIGAATIPVSTPTEPTSPHQRTSVVSSLQRRRSRRRSSSPLGGKKQRQPTGESVATAESKLRARRASGRELRREAGKLMTVEESATGNVELGVYLTYFKYMRWDLTILIVILYFIWNGLSVFNSIWLSEWSNDADRFASPAQANSPSNRNYRLGIYGVIGAVQGIFIIVSTYIFAYSSMRAAAKLHSNMLNRVMHAPMSFFDTTPSGRLLNRFSKDVDSLDTNVPANLRMFFTTFCVVLSMVFTICYSTPIFLVMLLPLGLLYFIAQRFYVCSSRQLRRLESVMRSPIYSLFGESITGQAVIRAAQQERRFIAENERRIDLTNMAYFPYIESQRWLNLGLSTVGALAVFSAALFAVFARESGVASGIVGLAISNALAITGPLNWMVRQTSELETNIISAERMKEYTEIVQEPPWELPGDDADVPRDWPQKGAVDFNHYETRYRAGLDLVLRGITAHIQPSEKVGIVGRTGAGKSSLTLALFRLIEPAGGSIVIDDVDIVKIGLHKLRSRLTIIPQDPVLFSGTLRFNLDPGEKHTDDALWRALEQAHLKQWATATSEKLEFAVAEEGQNLSVGQRQLVCLARALLRKTRILVLDEATAAVDLETDELIQESIRTEFKDSTVLTIAHRLNTILDYDRVMVLADGRIKEFDSPKNLLATLPANGTNGGNGGAGEPSEFALLARDANITSERIAALGLADSKNNNNGARKTNGHSNVNTDTNAAESAPVVAAAATSAAAAAAMPPPVNTGTDNAQTAEPVNFVSEQSFSNNNQFIEGQKAAAEVDEHERQPVENIAPVSFVSQLSSGNNNNDDDELTEGQRAASYADDKHPLVEDVAPVNLISLRGPSTEMGDYIDEQHGGDIYRNDNEDEELTEGQRATSYAEEDEQPLVGDVVVPANLTRQRSPSIEVGDYINEQHGGDIYRNDDDDDEQQLVRSEEYERGVSNGKSDEEGLGASFIGKTLEEGP